MYCYGQHLVSLGSRRFRLLCHFSDFQLGPSNGSLRTLHDLVYQRHLGWRHSSTSIFRYCNCGCHLFGDPIGSWNCHSIWRHLDPWKKEIRHRFHARLWTSCFGKSLVPSFSYRVIPLTFKFSFCNHAARTSLRSHRSVRPSSSKHSRQPWTFLQSLRSLDPLLRYHVDWNLFFNLLPIVQRK